MDAKLNFLIDKFAKQNIMRTPKLKFFFLASTFLAFVLLIFSCAGFQNSSYYQSDGIYEDKVVVVNKTEKSNGKYYKQYFQNLEDDYSSVTDDAVYFTDAEAYANPIDNEIQPAGQIPWGGQTNSTDIYVFNNQPAFGLGFNNFGWGFSNFDLGFGPYYYTNGGRFRPFNPYGYNPYLGFGYNNPYFRFGFRNRFFNPWWNGYSPFYNPFFNPFFGGYAGLHYRPNFYRNYYNNRFFRNNRGLYYNRAYVGLSKGRRGEKAYQNSRDRNNRNERAQNSQRKNNDFAVRASVNRLNIGRNSMYLGGLTASREEFGLGNKVKAGSAIAPSSVLRNDRNLQQYGVTKNQAENVSRKGRRFSQSRYSNEPVFRDARAVRRANNSARQNNSTRQNYNVQKPNYNSRQNYSTNAQPSSSNYSRSSGSSYRSGSATRSSGSNRGSTSSRGGSSGRRN